MPTIYAAVNQRLLSRFKKERAKAAKQITCNSNNFKEISVEKLANAFWFSRIIVYAQGFHLLQEASATFKWQIDLSLLSKIWRAGCIIRSKLLAMISDAFVQEDVNHLLDDGTILKTCIDMLSAAQEVSAYALSKDIAIPAINSALDYFNAWHTADLPINMIQAQRDFFGAHRYLRKDDQNNQLVHTNWEN
ncbi:MAG: hypothetical protein AAGK97_13240 [Bacteroidota bacterium]